MKTAILAILLVGCGGGDFTSTGSQETGGSSPMGETTPTETGGMPTASPNVAGAPSGAGGMLGTGGTSSAGGVTAAGGMVVTSSGGSENLAGSTSTGGIPSAGGETGSGGIPSNNGGNTAIGTGGIPMAAGGSIMVETGGTTSAGGMAATGGTTGIDNHCPLTADTGLACEPGQYVRSCVNGMAEVRVSLTWSSNQVMKVTSDSPFGCQVTSTDAIGYHVRTVCLGAPVTFTLPQVW